MTDPMCIRVDETHTHTHTPHVVVFPRGQSTMLTAECVISSHCSPDSYSSTQDLFLFML